jgi:hypothetical protein
LIGLTNATQAPTDNPAVVNLTFVYIGPPKSDKGPLDISGFTALSRYGAVNPDGTFTYQSEVDGFSGQAGVDAGIGSIEVPTADVPSTADRHSFAAPQGWSSKDPSRWNVLFPFSGTPPRGTLLAAE